MAKLTIARLEDITMGRRAKQPRVLLDSDEELVQRKPADAPREVRTTVVATGGCYGCEPGGETIWNTENSANMAMRHHDETGHTTWASESINTVYGPVVEDH